MLIIYSGSYVSPLSGLQFGACPDPGRCPGLYMLCPYWAKKSMVPCPFRALSYAATASQSAQGKKEHGLHPRARLGNQKGLEN
jgi:hypothetical protein